MVSPKLVSFGLLTVLLAVSGCVTSHRLPGSTGIVLEAGTQTPVVDATVLASYTKGGVVLVGTAEGCTTYYATKTDDAGRFTIPPKTAWNVTVPPLWMMGIGDSEIAIYKDGYEPSRAARSMAREDVLVLLRRLESNEDWQHAEKRLGFGFCPNRRYRPRQAGWGS